MCLMLGGTWINGMLAWTPLQLHSMNTSRYTTKLICPQETRHERNYQEHPGQECTTHRPETMHHRHHLLQNKKSIMPSTSQLTHHYQYTSSGGPCHLPAYLQQWRVRTTRILEWHRSKWQDISPVTYWTETSRTTSPPYITPASQDKTWRRIPKLLTENKIPAISYIYKLYIITK